MLECAPPPQLSTRVANGTRYKLSYPNDYDATHPIPLLLSLVISLPFGIASIYSFHASRHLPRVQGIRLGSLLAAVFAALAICSMHYSMFRMASFSSQI